VSLNNLPNSIQGTQFERDLRGLEDITRSSNKEIQEERRVGRLLIVMIHATSSYVGLKSKGAVKLLMGTRLNKMSYSYLIDGKNRLLAIKDDKGHIKARSIIRLLWDGEKPVLFLEKIYPDILDEKLTHELVDLC